MKPRTYIPFFLKCLFLKNVRTSSSNHYVLFSYPLLDSEMNNNFLPLSTRPIILLLLIPTALVFGQTNPWALFQQLCQGGSFATGPQCQNLGTSGSSSVCVSVVSVSEGNLSV